MSFENFHREDGLPIQCQQVGCTGEVVDDTRMDEDHYHGVCLLCLHRVKGKQRPFRVPGRGGPEPES